MPSKPPVERITVDEVLDRALIRLLIAPLAAGVKTISDRDDEWEDEREELVDPAETLRCLGLRGANRRKMVELFLGEDKADIPEPDLLRGSREQILLRFIKEGQVLLRGRFRIKGNRSNPDSIAVCDGPADILRIDHIPAVKDISKRLYAEALANAKVKGGQR